MIDLHCHLLPYVDDGAHDLEEAEKLLSMEAEQGVTALCLTPHLREGMFETPDEALRRQWERLRPMAAAKGLQLFLSREYHCDDLFWDTLDAGQTIPIGDTVLLLEFSTWTGADQMRSAVREIRRRGLFPLLAHAERYAACDVPLIEELREAGALIQVNADAVLGCDGLRLKRLTWKLLHAGLVDLIASDAHSSDERPPRLRDCNHVLKKKLGDEQAERLLLSTPRKMIMGNYHG